MKNLKKGFTLIELMIVVAIIAILAVVAAPKFGEQLKKAKDSKAVSLLGTYRSALTMNAADNEAVYALTFQTLANDIDEKTKQSSYDSSHTTKYSKTTFTTSASIGSVIATDAGTSDLTSAGNRPYIRLEITGSATESSIALTGSSLDTKGTSWASY